MAGAPREWVIDRKPWRWLPGAMALAVFAVLGLDPAYDRPSPPWPDLLITCGRRTAAISIAIRRASEGRCATVHIQDPQTRLSAFDLVVAMDHDAIAGPNVIKPALRAARRDRQSAWRRRRESVAATSWRWLHGR